MQKEKEGLKRDVESQKTNKKWSPGKRKHVTEIEESRRVEGHETVAVAEGVRHACG